ncbi:MAG: ABC transporter substrate-binding protein [Chloroflexota bacterium]
MKKIGKFLKKAGRFLFFVVLALVVIIGAFVLWLRAEPEEVAACDAGFRHFETDIHTSCVPEVAERVLPFSPSATQFFLAVGYQPVGHLTIVDQVAFIDQPHLVAAWNEIIEGTPAVTIGESWPPNLESTIAAEPDVILSEYGLSFVSKLVERIAPVVELDQRDWKASLLFTGDVIGEMKAAEEMIADYEMRVQILRELFDDPSEITISAVNVRPDRLVLHLPGSFSSQIIEEVGFSFPDAQIQLDAELDQPFSTYHDVSEERIDLMEGDVIFLYGLETASFDEEEGFVSGDAVVDELLTDPLIQQLDVIQRGAHYPGGNYWQRGGIYSAHAVLDDLFRHVAGVDPEEIAPNPLLLE